MMVVMTVTIVMMILLTAGHFFVEPFFFSVAVGNFWIMTNFRFAYLTYDVPGMHLILYIT